MLQMSELSIFRSFIAAWIALWVTHCVPWVLLEYNSEKVIWGFFFQYFMKKQFFYIIFFVVKIESLTLNWYINNIHNMYYLIKNYAIYMGNKTTNE